MEKDGGDCEKIAFINKRYLGFFEIEVRFNRGKAGMNLNLHVSFSKNKLNSGDDSRQIF